MTTQETLVVYKEVTPTKSPERYEPGAVMRVPRNAHHG